MSASSQGQAEALVTLVGNAIYKHQVETARKRAASFAIDLNRIRRVFTTAFAESDRSAAILLFALAEDLMLHCLREYLNANVPGGWKSVTDANGVLATASDRITILHLLFWIRGATSADLRLLKSIRNRFAHHADVDSFDDPKIRGWVSSLSPYETPALATFDPSELASWPKPTSRELFFYARDFHHFAFSA